ncbi:MAG: glutathione S-transferase family protein [Sphingomonas sp.]|uniref:glutathione S-transferase family protein n=1 Tax=Sphingomonas sp. TaxID=28214 RepID=UPI000DAFF395|nr:glutathione S-transferase family protein [Sphingomonas sp.]PZP16268.1 MAG: glutathione S-transferase [Sphingomonas hengshuiensis]
MIYFDAANPAPNPRRVRIFLAEKGIKLTTKLLSIPAGEHKHPDFLAINPLGQVPALALDDGEVITESVSICRFLEALNPDPPLFGRGPKGVAEVDMWVRRVELRLMMPVGMVWAHTHPFTARVVKPQYTEYGESNRPRALAAMAEIDAALEGRPWLAGKDYSMADIVLLSVVDFAEWIGLKMPEELGNLRSWHERASARPSAAA